MGPLARLWKALFDVKNYQTLTLTLSLVEVATTMDKTVLLLGQSFQATAHHGWSNAFSSVIRNNRKLKKH